MKLLFLVYLLPFFPKLLQTPESDEYHSQFP